MKHSSKALFLAMLALPGLALAHPGHAPLAGLPDLLLHHPWTARCWCWRWALVA